MKWREPKRSELSQIRHPKGFDDYEFRLGDILRGERATLGKSLLDVEKELKIKTNYLDYIRFVINKEYFRIFFYHKYKNTISLRY